MKLAYYRCDRCGAEPLTVTDTQHPCFTVGREMDAAGSMDDIADQLDLCVGCAADLLSSALEGLTREQRVLWFKGARNKR